MTKPKPTDDAKISGMETLFAFVDEAAAAEDFVRIVAILDSYRDDKSFVELCQRALLACYAMGARYGDSTAAARLLSNIHPASSAQ